MRMRVVTVYLIVVFGYAFAQEPRAGALSEPHRIWLEEEVVYIITEREREAFLSLGTDEERRSFIDAFWSKRDPNPVTPANEFQEEHYRRLAHANTELDAQSLLPGWKTERGRIYIMLGEPRSVERFSMDNRLVTCELWFYEGDTRKALPPFFNLIFFKRMDTGELRLYSPGTDGPAALLRGRFGVQPQIAIETINRISPELARASLSIEARAGGDIDSGVASLANEVTMARIEDSPSYAIRTDYLDGWERYGDRVAAEYSFNFVPSRSVFAVLPGYDGVPYLHLGIELDPENFSLESDERETKFYTTLDVSVEARTADGALVFVDDKETYIELTRSQLESIRMAPIAYQDSFPVISGDYFVTVIVRNRVHSRFTAAEANINVPAFDDTTPALSDPVLGYLVETMPEDTLGTFQTGGSRVHPAAARVFTESEWLQTLFQLVGANADHRLRLAISSGDGVVTEREVSVAAYPKGAVREAFVLDGMISGDYRFSAELVDIDGARLAGTEVPFQISPRTAIARPSFITRHRFPSHEPGRVALTRAEQRMSVGQFEEAVHALEQAVAANPGLPHARWKLAAACNRMRQPDRALELLLPMADAFAAEFEVSMGLGVAYYIKEDFDNAVLYFERAIGVRPPNASQLNALGNSYARLGRVDEARAVYQRSLTLDPSQGSVERALGALPGSAATREESR
jgi:GWxTD domain-containing protein